MEQGCNRFDFQDLDDIILGAHFYACGGGGALENGRQLVEETKKALQKRGLDYIEFLAPQDVPDNGWLPVLGAMGAPQQFLKYGYGKSPVSAFLTHERLLQVRLGNPSLTFCSMIAAESGTIAHGMALLVAATLGLPIVDGDGAGRAIPTLQMVTFANPDTKANIQLPPCVLTSETAVKEGGASLTLDCNDSASVDALARGIISAGAGFEDRASLSCFAMTGGQVKQPNAIVCNTLSKARDLGRSVRTSTDPVKTVAALPTAKLVCQGEITKVESSTRGGFDWLDVHIKAGGDEYVVVAKNENMLVWSKQHDTPLVLSPDLICYIQPDGTVLSNSEIEAHFQQNTSSMPVALFSLRADKAIDAPWFHQQYAAVFESYGYYGPYHPPL
jgi:DUF917 family protein